MPPALPPDLLDPVEHRSRLGPERQLHSGGRACLELPDEPDRDVVQTPTARVLDDLVRGVHLRDHRLHVADAGRSAGPEPRRCAAAGGVDALEAVVAGEVIDPGRAGREVADEVEDLVAGGIDGCADGQGPHGRAILEPSPDQADRRRSGQIRHGNMPGKGGLSVLPAQIRLANLQYGGYDRRTPDGPSRTERGRGPPCRRDGRRRWILHLPGLLVPGLLRARRVDPPVPELRWNGFPPGIAVRA